MEQSDIKLTKDDIEKIKEKAREEARQEFEDFSKFAFRGSMIQMSVAFILGAAFKNVVTSISENLIMPIINFLLNKTGTEWRALSWTPIDGMVFEFGKFMGSFVDFLIIAIILYIIWKKIFKGEEKT